MSTSVHTALLRRKTGAYSVVFNPLCSGRITPLTNFYGACNVGLIVPFSVDNSSIRHGGRVFRMCRDPRALGRYAVGTFLGEFAGIRPVFMSYGSSASHGKTFAFKLHGRLRGEGVGCDVAGIDSDVSRFTGTFLPDGRGIIVLGANHSPRLATILGGLSRFSDGCPNTSVSLFNCAR